MLGLCHNKLGLGLITIKEHFFKRGRGDAWVLCGYARALSLVYESLDGTTRLCTTTGGKNLTYNFKSSLTQ